MSDPNFPSWVHPLTEEIEKNAGVRLVFRELLVGKSGSFVSLVDCTGKHDGLLVLKAGNIPNGYESELNRHRAAVTAGAFRRSVPEILASAENDRHFVFVSKLAGGAHLQWRPLLSTPSVFRSGYEQLNRVLWTPELLAIRVGLGVSTAIELLINYQIDSSRGGRVLENATRALGPWAATHPWFTYRDRVLPNPVHFVLHPDMWIGRQVTFVLGPLHGDCHAKNVLARTNIRGGVDDVRLIDLASYQSSAPLFYDNSYFELATLLRELDGLGEGRWLSLCDSLAREDLDPHSLEQVERGWCQDILAARKALDRLIHKKYPNRADDFRIQRLIVSAVSAVAFLNKASKVEPGSIGLSNGQYQQAMTFGALHLDQCIREMSIVGPPRTDTTPSFSPMPIRTERLAETDWSAVGNFDSNGVNILLLGPVARSAYTAELEPLLALPWNIVVDFSSEPIPPQLLSQTTRIFRQTWSGAEQLDLKMLDRGSIWYFGNGRVDLSDCRPSDDDRDWRRRHYRGLYNFLASVHDEHAPRSVRVLGLLDGLDSELASETLKALDSLFGDRLRVPILGIPESQPDIKSIPNRCGTSAAVLSELIARKGPALRGPTTEPLVPQRTLSGEVTLCHIGTELLKSVSRDLELLTSSIESSFPPDREFAADFHRGKPIEWAELANNIDVERSAYPVFERRLQEALEQSNNRTVNLFHEPSAGGTTLSRRLAWNFRAKYPVVFLRQLSSDTAGYLRDLFQWAKLPILVVMEGGSKVTESGREALLRELREDNTRASFLWVARTYDTRPNQDILLSHLTKGEARCFLDAYLPHALDDDRRSQLRYLAKSPTDTEQCSPFFFGLIAFGERYFGLERLIDSATNNLDDRSSALLGDLALVSYYSNSGFPVLEFDELLQSTSDELASTLAPPLVVRDEDHIRVAHVLLARKLLQRLARDPERWHTDLLRFGIGLLSRLKTLHVNSAERLRQMVQSVFLTRDTATAISSDAESQAGSLLYPSRFSKYIREIGNAEQARNVLEHVAKMWPQEPHFAVHFARHLLYERPTDISKAFAVIESAEQSRGGATDDVVVHTHGMCFRQRMISVLEAAVSEKTHFNAIAAEVERDCKEALLHFQRSVELGPAGSEYGQVAAIQTCTRLLKHAVELSGAVSLAEFFRSPAHAWCIEILRRAEDQIDNLRSTPSRNLSDRAVRVAAEWRLVYGNVEAVVSQLHSLAQSRQTPELRSAFCRAVLLQHERRWAAIPAEQLRLIKSFCEQNIDGNDVRETDLRTWLRSVRALKLLDLDVALRRVIDWSQLRPTAVEPAYYAYIFYFLKWLSSSPRNPSLAAECASWLKKCSANRERGDRSLSYEWLVREHGTPQVVHFSDLAYDPVAALRGQSPQSRRIFDQQMYRLEGTVRDYKGPQSARLDLGQGLKVRITPLAIIGDHHVGQRATAVISFAHDEIVGWDPKLVT